MQRITVLVVICALLLGIILGVNVFTNKISVDNTDTTANHPVESSHKSTDLASLVDSLTARLEENENRLLVHQQLLDQLNEEIAVLKHSTAAVRSRIEVEEAAPEDEPASQAIGVNSFLNAGFSSDRAYELEERYADLELRRLYLRDKALREGWISEPRFAEERAKLNAEEALLADELGEQAYDRYLYATGQSNRVSVSSVIRKSPAETSGIESGDIIYRYAGSRIYDAFDLRNATSDGDAGESVAIEVLRDDDLVEIYIPRGPLGVQLQSDSVKP